jgi:hypothetical protein
MKEVSMTTDPPKRLTSFGAIETMYRAFNFRSRLEATWAVFFDACGWNWAYEPVDLNGYIPDFAIGHRPTLVEIKPFFHEADWPEAISKIIAADCRERIVLLGANPVWIAKQITNQSDMAPAIGWIAEPIEIDGELQFQIERLHFGFTEGNRKLGLCPLDSAWKNVIHDSGSQGNGKWDRVELENADLEKELTERWALAQNNSRWIPTAKK